VERERAVPHGEISPSIDAFNQVFVGFPESVPKLFYLHPGFFAHDILYQEGAAVEENDREDGNANERDSHG
jgi:hypothetical protein